MRLYRYVRALNNKDKAISNKLKETLVYSKIHFSHPASFNDPLECTIPIKIEDYDMHGDKYREYLETIMSEIIGDREHTTDRNERIYEAIEYGIPLENCLIACFSKISNNQLMWSHYADQHQGICLCYDFPDTTEEWNKQIKWSDDVTYDINNHGMTCIGGKVIYQKQRPSIRIEDPFLSVGEWKITNACDIKSAIFIKPECWRYEQEWRLVLHFPHGSGKGFAAGINTNNYHAIIPKEWLKEITFGLRLNKKYCSEIVEIIKEAGYNDVLFNKAKMAHDEFRVVSEPF